LTGLVYKSTVKKLSLSDRTGLFYWLMLFSVKVLVLFANDSRQRGD